MPPRAVVVLVVVFWLVMTGLLVRRDLWPQWRPGEPPAFGIDLVEETHHQKVERTWKVRLNEALEEKVMEVGSFHQDEYGYTPHLTLGRVSDAGAGAVLASELQKRLAWDGGRTTVEDDQRLVPVLVRPRAHGRHELLGRDVRPLRAADVLGVDDHERHRANLTRRRQRSPCLSFRG